MPLGPVAAAEPIGQGGDLGGGSGQARGQRGAAERIDVGLVDEVEARLEVRQDVEQAVAERDDRPGQAAGELLQGGVELCRRPRVDHAEHRLGPRQVEPAREERAERELARRGVPGTPGQALGQDQLDQRRRADRCGSRPAAAPCRCGDRARARSPRGAAASGPPPAAAPSRRSGRVGSGARDVGLEARQRDRPRLGPRQPHQAAKPRPGGAGDRRNRVGRVEGAARRSTRSRGIEVRANASSPPAARPRPRLSPVAVAVARRAPARSAVRLR